MAKPTLAERILEYNIGLEYEGRLPDGIRMLNPFQQQPEILDLCSKFYSKFYGDTGSRKLILGINPGRLGAGATGIPFTDSKRLADPCGIDPGGLQTHEPSSVFVYEVIAALGGPREFYGNFYINSVCPLGFVRRNNRGNWVNCNYYDFPELYQAVRPFILENLRWQVALCGDTDTCYVLGKKNAAWLEKINLELGAFKEIRVLDHPRYIVQYKSRQMPEFVDGYCRVLADVGPNCA